MYIQEYYINIVKCLYMPHWAPIYFGKSRSAHSWFRSPLPPGTNALCARSAFAGWQNQLLYIAKYIMCSYSGLQSIVLPTWCADLSAQALATPSLQRKLILPAISSVSLSFIDMSKCCERILVWVVFFSHSLAQFCRLHRSRRPLMTFRIPWYFHLLFISVSTPSCAHVNVGIWWRQLVSVSWTWFIIAEAWHLQLYFNE